MLSPESNPSADDQESSGWLLELADRFDAAWQGEAPPNLDSFLPDGLLERRLALRQLAQIDLEYRFRAVERARVESYVQRFPELAEDATALHDLIAKEFSLRRQLSAPSLAEFRRRFPAVGDDAFREVSTGAGFLADRNAGGPNPDSTVDDALNARPQDSASVGPRPKGGELRFRPLRLHAKGGLGEVWLAEDTELHRQVALKRIQARYHGVPESRRRFLL